MASLYFYRDIKAEDDVFLEIEALKVESPPLPDPGADRYADARELLASGELEAARSKLSYVLKYYDHSKNYADAKRIIGEMNLDRLLSSAPMTGKIDYTVQRGDSLLAIAGRNSCTVGYILRSNNMMSTRIHPGDRLLVCPLEFTVVIDAAGRTLTLTREEQFFKEYSVRQLKLPYGARSPFQTALTDKVALLDQRRIPLTDDRVQEAEKWLRTKVPGLVFGAFEEESESATENPESDPMMVGVLMDRPDLEELFTLLRVSTPVKVVQ